MVCTSINYAAKINAWRLPSYWCDCPYAAVPHADIHGLLPLAVSAFCTTETSQVFTTPPTIPPLAIIPLSCLFHSLGVWSMSCRRTPRAKLRFWSKVQTGSVTPLRNLISQITLLLFCRPAADRHTPWWCQLVMCVWSQAKQFFCGFTLVAQHVLSEGYHYVGSAVGFECSR